MCAWWGCWCEILILLHCYSWCPGWDGDSLLPTDWGCNNCMELQPGNLQYLPALRPGHNTSITTSPSSQYNIQSEKMSAFTVICDRGYVLCIILPFTSSFKTASFHWFYFYFSFQTEMSELLSLCTDPGGCSKPDGGYSKDFQYFNIQIFPITKYTSDGEIWFSIWKIFSSAGLRETCLNSLFMVKFPELV